MHFKDFQALSRTFKFCRKPVKVNAIFEIPLRPRGKGR
jgi:hypothetical protein